MNPILTTLNFFKEYTAAIGLVSLIAAGFWAAYKFKKHLRDQRFKTYHDLIDQFVNEQRYPDRTIKLDRQIAIVFELRNFPEYYEVSKRILRGWLNEKEEEKRRIPRLFEEIEISLECMERNRISRWFYRFFFS